MGEYWRALSFHEKALDIRQKTLHSNRPDIVTSYNNIGLTYSNMDEYLKALSFCERAVALGQRSLSPNDPNLQAFRNNLDCVKKKL
ncbi:unnamed protein product [Rotaria sp. Silwood2]|nr:unnamed protein product [Rotaria sp. Silwood2]CAF4416349.1 unnamed protein product [Rotaria sp. Silwood2]CAF4726454.1 unnamed protein product [Rotaria sp. Silwood2]